MELEDRSAQGRACGNLGNTHYLLGNFNEAITYHEEVTEYYLSYTYLTDIFNFKLSKNL